MKLTHRPQSVQPDLDDVLLRPNMARAAENLRFSAGEDDTNLGITAVRGNRALDSGRFVEGQQTIGFFISEELGAIFQAIWRPTNEHSIEMIEPRLDNKITTVAIGSWLKFQNNTFVSIAYVDGKLYFTDEVNPPRLLNVNKAINTWGGGTGDEVYQPEPAEWTVSRVKRQPAARVLAEANININDNFFGIVRDFNPKAPNQGYQFAYYYVYDNFENSRLSPYSEVIFTTAGISTQLPTSEEPYFNLPFAIKEVVIAYRLGNLGTWYELKRIKPTGQSIRYEISDMRHAPRIPIPGELLTDQFDDVPLTSGWNAVIENRLIDADFVQGYDNWEGLSLSVEFKEQLRGEGNFQTTFKPGAQVYNFGIELLDESGRRSSVINQQTFETPEYEKWYLQLDSRTNINSVFGILRDALNPVNYNQFGNDPFFNLYTAEATVRGAFPDWAKYMRVVYSRNQSTNVFYRTQAKMLYWYKANGEDYFFLNAISTVPNRTQNPNPGGSTFDPVTKTVIDNKSFNYEGIVIFLAQDEPFLFDEKKINYVDVIGAVHLAAMDRKNPSNQPITETYTIDDFRKIAKKYVITKAEENKLFIKLSDFEKESWFVCNYLGDPPIGLGQQSIGRYYTTSLDIELSVQKDISDPFYYQTNSIVEIDRSKEEQKFILFGDCYTAEFKKTYRGLRTPIERTINLDSSTNTGSTFNWGAGSFDIYGTYISMNPTDIYNQNWDSDIGQSTIVNPNQEQKTFKNTPLLSNPLFPGTKINGLSQVSSLDQPDQYSLDAGPITGVISTTGVGTEPGVVLFICENNWFSTYLNATEIQLGQGTGALSVADRFFGSRRLLQGRYGTKLRNTIQGTDKNFVYAYSDKVKDIIRYSGEGLQALGVTHGFGNLLDKEVGNGTSVSLGYDSFYDEIILVNKLTQEAYVYSERYKAFQGKRKYGLSPDFLGSLNENLYSTANGNYYVSDRSADMGRFYGLTPDIKLTIVPNANYVITKLWEHIEIYGEQPDVIRLYTKDGKQTTIFPNEIELIKDRVYGAFRADESSIGGKYNGSLIESNLCYIEIIWKVANFVKLNQIIVGAVPAVMQ